MNRFDIDKLNDEQINRLVYDNPEYDETPSESEPYDRGRTRGAQYIIRFVNEMLDGKYLDCAGTSNLPEWDALRKRLSNIIFSIEHIGDYNESYIVETS